MKNIDLLIVWNEKKKTFILHVPIMTFLEWNKQSYDGWKDVVALVYNMKLSF